MKFENEQAIFDSIKAVDKVPEWIETARSVHKDLKALVYGEEFKELLLRIEHIETVKKADARKKYSRPIKDVNRKLLAPVENVFSATGGTKQYKLSTDSATSEFIKTISNAREGKSIEQWLQAYVATDLYVVDPSGLIFMEWDQEKTYPTYKSILNIRYYKEKGMNIDYVIFEPKEGTDGENIWRVVDEAKDYQIIQKGENFTIAKENTHENPFGQCPGIILSDKKRLGYEGRMSPIDDIIETEKEFLRDRSILTIHKFLNGFSIPYRPGLLCPECKGTKKKGIEPCPDCDGTGLALGSGDDVTGEIILPIDMDSDRPPQLPTNWAGFISPDIEIWTQYRIELKELFKEMFEAKWGTRESDEVKDQTAMGVILNTQPMITELNKWSDLLESHELSITRFYAKYHYPSMTNYDDMVMINYGRNYIVQPPEYLLQQYHESNEKNDPVVVRDRKLHEYITSKYKNDPETLRSELVKKELEPYIHFDIKTIYDIYGQNEARKKGWFTDFWESLKESDKLKSVEKLEQEMNVYFENRNNELAILPNNQ